ncbi:MAG: hypothetical protein U0470_04290 [Anaerolineae bacterium]
MPGEGRLARALGRAIDALTAPAPDEGIHLTTDAVERVQPPGATATFTVTLANTGLLTRLHAGSRAARAGRPGRGRPGSSAPA